MLLHLLLGRQEQMRALFVQDVCAVGGDQQHALAVRKRDEPGRLRVRFARRDVEPLRYAFLARRPGAPCNTRPLPAVRYFDALLACDGEEPPARAATEEEDVRDVGDRVAVDMQNLARFVRCTEAHEDAAVTQREHGRNALRVFLQQRHQRFMRERPLSPDVLSLGGRIGFAKRCQPGRQQVVAVREFGGIAGLVPALGEPGCHVTVDRFGVVEHAALP